MREPGCGRRRWVAALVSLWVTVPCGSKVPGGGPLLAAPPAPDDAVAASGKGWTPVEAAWRGKLDAADPGLGKKPWYASDHDDSKWKSMRLPGHFEAAGLPGFDGTVWYRRTVELPPSLAGKPLVLELGPIDDMDMTWLNGQQVGGIERPGQWATPRRYTLAGKLVRAGRNVITVRVIDHGWSGGFAGSAARMKIGDRAVSIPLAGEWRYRVGVELESLGLGTLPNPPPPPPPPPVPALVRPLVRPASPAPAFRDGFAIDGDHSVVILGGSNAAESRKHAYIETLLVAAHPRRRLSVRNMAWQADTVYLQQRPKNFYSSRKPSYGEKDGRSPTRADILVLWMGQLEALDGTRTIVDFTDAYERTVALLTVCTARIVLVTPVPFEDPLRLGFDVEGRNSALAAHAAEIRRIGAARHLPVVDLFGALRGQGVTRDGVLLSARGHWLVATEIAGQLGFAGRIGVRLGESGALIPPAVESLRQAALRKNELWHQYWRPTNWGFLYGNRQTQPSSRSHLDRSRRWFPQEIASILPRLTALDRAIHESTSRLRSVRPGPLKRRRTADEKD